MKSKLRTDPVYEAVSEVLLHTNHELLDVGCGLGLLAFWLREHGFQPAIVGGEVESRKVDEAQRIAEQYYPQTSFITLDAAEGLPASCWACLSAGYVAISYCGPAGKAFA